VERLTDLHARTRTGHCTGLAFLEALIPSSWRQLGCSHLFARLWTHGKYFCTYQCTHLSTHTHTHTHTHIKQSTYQTHYIGDRHITNTPAVGMPFKPTRPPLIRRNCRDPYRSPEDLPYLCTQTQQHISHTLTNPNPIAHRTLRDT
jgi:hypothetical protein